MDIPLQKIDGAQYTKNFFNRSIRFLYQKTIEPKSTNEDLRRKEFILNVILIGSIGLLFFLDCIVAASMIETGPSYPGIQFSTFSIILVIFVSLFFLSKRGYITISSYLAIVFLYGCATYGVYRWGTDLPSTLLMYALLIVMTGALIGTRFSLVFSSIVIISIFLCRQLSDMGLIDPDVLWRIGPSKGLNVLGYGLFFFAIELIAWLSSKDIENSLSRARRSEQALREKNESLEEIVLERTRELKQAQMEKFSQLYRFAEFGRLSSGAFHDLMNPLSAVTTNIHELTNSAHPNIQEIRAHVDRAVLASKKLGRFMATVRKQIDMSEHEEIFSLNEEIEDALTLLSHKAIQEKVILDWSAPKLINIYGNPSKFQHIINNLISNGIDSYATKSELEKRIVSIRLFFCKNGIQLTIRDHGCGITPQLLEHIFDPFFTTKSSYKGLGIGLSETQKIVTKNFKGKITVKSVPGNGSVFTIILPYVRNLR